MDKIKQNIDLQEAIQRYNIEKSVVGTLAYNIDQNLQKGMSPDEAIEDVIQKSKSMPIGTIHNGFKKIAEGKWRKVQKQHENSSEDRFKDIRNKIKDNNGTFSLLSTSEYPISSQLQALTGDTYNMQDFHNVSDTSKLSANEGNIIVHKKSGKLFKMPESEKDYSDEEVTGGEKKESKSKYLKPLDEGMQDKLDYFKELPTLEEKEKYTDTLKNKWIPETEKDLKEAKFDSVKKIYSDLVDGFKQLLPHIEKELENFKNTQKSQPESTLSKSEQTEAQKAKVKKVVEEFNKGILKSSTGELITDRSEALRFALSEAGIDIQKGIYVNDAENRKLGRVGQHYGESNASKSDEEVTGGEKNIVEYRDEFIKTSKSPSVTKTLETKVKYDNGIRTKAENIEKLAQNGIFSERNIEHDRIKASKDHPDAFYTAGGYMREIDKESYILDGYYCSKTEFEYSKFLQNKLK